MNTTTPSSNNHNIDITVLKLKGAITPKAINNFMFSVISKKESNPKLIALIDLTYITRVETPALIPFIGMIKELHFNYKLNVRYERSSYIYHLISYLNIDKWIKPDLVDNSFNKIHHTSSIFSNKSNPEKIKPLSNLSA